jgi:hypothetical protein
MATCAIVRSTQTGRILLDRIRALCGILFLELHGDRGFKDDKSDDWWFRKKLVVSLL